MEVNVDEWQADENSWDFKFKELTENTNNLVENTFTKINVTNLNDDVKDNFDDPVL